MAKTGSPLPFATTAILFYNLYLFDHYHHVLDELIGREINAAFAGIVQADARALLVGGGPVLSQRPTSDSVIRRSRQCPGCPKADTAGRFYEYTP